MKIYLASKSPRRRALLMQMGIEFDVLPIDTPEIKFAYETAEMYSMRVTKEKLIAANMKMMNEGLTVMPILCADTEVVLDGNILGKPRDRQDAFNMLKNYSGRSHQVMTSVGVTYFNYSNVLIHETKVTFANIPDTAINHYLASNDFQDKAGGYGIQSYIGQFICNIEGCFYSVMGLPLNTVRELLIDLDKHQPRNSSLKGSCS